MRLRALSGSLLLACSVFALSACDTGPKAEPKAPQIFKEERQALDRAKGVQDTIDKQAEEQRRKIEDASK
jgi:hypothetical protein